MLVKDQLNRVIGLPLLTLYGLGTILGAGIYVLIGKVIGVAGIYAPIAFGLAAAIAAITALSYADLVARFPKSGGEAIYLLAAFKSRLLSGIIGYLVAFAGIVSAATIANGFVGYLKQYTILSNEVVIIVLLTSLTALAIWGIAQSLWVTAIITIVEIIGLLIVLFINRNNLTTVNMTTHFVPASLSDIVGILGGAFLAFYAYIGFEDMVNIVEEVKEPQKNMKRAIWISIIIATTLYLLISLVAVNSGDDLKAISQSDAPLVMLTEQHNNKAALLLSMISLFAITNGALVQIIMSSRMFYGMSSEKIGPLFLSTINKFTKTPINATLVAGLLATILALWFPLIFLAKLTSFVVLLIFTLVNIALCKIKYSNKERFILPSIAAILCLLLILFQIISLIEISPH